MEHGGGWWSEGTDFFSCHFRENQSVSRLRSSATVLLREIDGHALLSPSYLSCKSEAGGRSTSYELPGE